MRWAGVAMGGLLVWAAAVRAEEAREPGARTPMDFAEGVELTIRPELAVQTLLVPLTVYRGARDDLRDLSVFDARGEVVPHALRALEPALRTALVEREVALFPLPGSAARNSEVALQVERDAQGTLIAVRVSDPVQAEPAETAAYVFDASKLAHPAVRLRVALPTEIETFTLRVAVEASDDLAHWARVSDTAVLGKLVHEGASVVRDDVALVPTRAKFLRLRSEGGALPKLLHAFLQEAHDELSSGAVRLTFQSDKVEQKAGRYDLDLGAALPLTDLAPLLPSATLVLGDLTLRARRADSEERVFTGPFYRMVHDGAELRSRAVELGGRRARYVGLQLDPRTAGALRERLSFEVGYAPEQLLFVSRGEGPYLLAYGSYKEVAPPLSADQLLAFMPEEVRAELPRESVKLGAAKSLLGPSARIEPPPARSYKESILWAVLIAGAATLLGLAVRLMRRMQ